MKLALIASALLLGLSTPASAQQPKPLFATWDPIHLVITGPVTRFGHNRNTSTVVQATLTDPSGQALPITLSPRGITRRASDICDFPPLRVRFTAPPPPTSVFAGQKSLKLVTHCRNKADFQQYVLLEYSAYKMYNLLTPRSFRARLANIDYRDADGKPIISRVGYFLEDLSDVAKRNGMKETHAPPLISASSLSPHDAARYAMFQHMIANHDWSMRAGPQGRECCHNAELIGPYANGATIPIPYDFDFSGFVDTPYATPPEQLKISSVRQRFYRGYCAHNAEALAVAQQMRAERPQMFAAITSTSGLDPGWAARAIAFLNPFFADIATDASTNDRILRRCT